MRRPALDAGGASSGLHMNRSWARTADDL